MRLIALKNHYYPPSTTRQSGQEYEASQGDAVVLVGARLAEYATRVTSPVKDALEELTVYETKEQEPTPLSKDKPAKKKRQYKRRDMNPA